MAGKKRSRTRGAPRLAAKNANIDRNYLLALGILLIFALCYSLLFVGGPSFYGDDTVYANLAYYAVHGSFAQSSFIFSVRLLNIYPTALFYYLFGVNLYTDSAWDILSFLGLIAVSYFLGKELHSNLAGIISASLIAFFPLIVQISATISDDIPLAFFAALAMLALLYAQRRRSKRWYFAAGVLLIATPLITPEGLIVIIVAAAYIAIELLRGKIKPDQKFLHIIYGALLAVGLLLAFNYINCGDPLITFTTNSNFYSAVGQQNTIPSTNTDPGFYPQTMLSYNVLGVLSSSLNSGNLNPLSIWSQIYRAGPNISGFYFYVFVIAALYLLLSRERRAYFALFWFLASFLYLEFGPMHVSLFPFSYLLAYRLGRFLTILAVPLAVTIGIALARSMLDSDRVAQAAGIVASIAIFLLLILTALPINMMWHQSLYASTYDQIAIANYLSQVPNSTSIYFTGAFSNVPVYMQFANLNRFYSYDSIKDCRQIPPGAYVIIPKSMQVMSLNYTPDPLLRCPNWILVLSPQLNLNLSSSIVAQASPFGGKLYFVPANSTNSTLVAQSGIGPTTPDFPSAFFNYFNLTGAGRVNLSSGEVENFVNVNNVTSVNVTLNKSAAFPGEPVLASVLFHGSFKWYKNNASSYYLGSNVINLHYYGVEYANQSGMLLDQNNGPWYNLLSQIGDPQQLISGDANALLLINWVISPTAAASNSALKICGGYFATYTNTTDGGGWSNLYNKLSMAQLKIVNSSAISIPSGNCALLSVK
ncbi:MAG: glycosyltransferase family 39 protein [Candidatus Micrarchaeota archaeon]|nr:glycosyltransferase family 39 protein [Candidatus Micrarchaeota archaeon]